MSEILLRRRSHRRSHKTKFTVFLVFILRDLSGYIQGGRGRLRLKDSERFMIWLEVTSLVIVRETGIIDSVGLHKLRRFREANEME